MLTREQAIDKVTENCEAAAVPTLSPDDIAALVDEACVAVLWAANATRSFDQRVLPTGRNGEIWKVVIPGVSSSVEPTWPRMDLYAQNRNFNGYFNGELWPDPPYNGVFRVQDGTATLEYAGADNGGEIYDVRAASYAGWLKKARKAANKFDVSIDNQKATRSQIRQACREAAQDYAPFGF